MDMAEGKTQGRESSWDNWPRVCSRPGISHRNRRRKTTMAAATNMALRMQAAVWPALFWEA